MIGSLRPTAKGGHASSLSNRTMIQAISFGLIKTFRRKKHRPTHLKSFKQRHSLLTPQTRAAPRGPLGGAHQRIGETRSVALSSGLVCLLRQIAQQFEEVL
jgi:hypothetical protein